MGNWGAWDWIGYGCLAISAFGVAIREFAGGRVGLRWSRIARHVPLTFFILGSLVFIGKELWPATSSTPTVYIEKFS